jgi:hypothetical protein
MGNAVRSVVSTFLERYPGLPFCAVCLAHEIGARPEEIRAAMSDLGAPGFATAQRFCVRCARPQPVIYSVPQPRTGEPGLRNEA